jgi:hypothetical protein
MWSMPKSEQCNYVLTCVGSTTDLQCSHAALSEAFLCLEYGWVPTKDSQ